MDRIKSITLVPLGGLCNRLRAILSAVALARDCRVPLRVMWLRDAGLNACFEDLFEPLPNSAITIVDTESRMRYAVARQRNLFLPALWQRCAFDTILTESTLMPLCNDSAPEELAGRVRNTLAGNVLIQTGLGFYPADDRQLMALFVPGQEVRRMMEERLLLITPHTVGLHIRRTDNAMSIKHSPLEAFETAMEADIARDAATAFYIATDDPAVMTRLAERFQGRVVSSMRLMTHKRDSKPTGFFAGRSTPEGMQTAVAELFALIACPRFHGSYWSSYSDMVVACHEAGQADIIYAD